MSGFEVVGAFSGAVGILHVCLKLCGTIVEYVHDFKEARTERKLLLWEMQNVESTIRMLLHLRESDETGQPVEESLPGGLLEPLKRMRKLMEQVKDKLEPNVSESAKRKAAQDHENSHHSEKVGSGKVDVHPKHVELLKVPGDIAGFWQNLKWPYEKKEIIDVLQYLERAKSDISLFLATNEFMLLNFIEEGVEQIRRTSNATNQSVEDIKPRIESVHEKSEQSKFDEILDWLSTLQFADRYKDLCHERQDQPKNGTWFLESDQYKTWIAGRNQILYATGIAGSGKTMMTSIILSHLMKYYQTVPLAYVFFDSKSQGMYKRFLIVASILRQLLQQQGTIPPEIEDLYKKLHTENRPLDVDQLRDTLRSFLSSQDQVFIVLDALDEYSDDRQDRDELLDEILQLQDFGRVSVLLTARPDASESTSLDSALQIEIRPHEEDVRTFVKARMSLMPRFVQKSIDLQGMIMNGICQAARDMFILARLHLKTIRSARTKREVHTALEHLPADGEGLKDLYNRYLERIASKPEEHRQRLHRMLELLVYGKRLLEPKELGHALAVCRGTGKIDEDDVPDIDDLVEDCEGLVTRDPERGVVRLIHETTQEFLRSSFLNEDAELHLSQLCLEYLMMADLTSPFEGDEKLQQLRSDYPFLRYATRYWGEHISNVREVDHELEEQILKFLRLPYRVSDTLTARWTHEMWVRRGMELWKGYNFDPKGHRPFEGEKPHYHFTGSHLAVAFGLTSFLDILIKESGEPNPMRQGRRTLVLAAKLDKLDAMKVMIKHGAIIHQGGESGRSPIHFACETASLDMVQFMVEHGADIDKCPPSSEGEPPICCACFYDRAEIVGYLLDQGAKVDTAAPQDPNMTPFAMALDKGRPKCLELLILKRKLLTPERASRLILPLESGSILQRLLQTNIDPNQTFGLGQSSLDVAIRLQEANLIRSCLKLGAIPKVYWDMDCEEVQSLDSALLSELKPVLEAQEKPVLKEERNDPVISTRESGEHTPYLELTIPDHCPNTPSKLIFTTVSHDQGWSKYPHDHGSYHGSYSRLAADIIERDPANGNERAVTVREQIVYNVHASGKFKKHITVWQEGHVRPEVEEWMNECRPGRTVRVFAEALNLDWENHVKMVRVEIF